MAEMTPPARDLADAHGLDVPGLVEAGHLTPTGASGDVLKLDVQAYLDALATAEAAEADADGDGVSDGAQPGFPGQGFGRYRRPEGAGQLPLIVAGAHRLLHSGPVYKLPADDPAVRAALKGGDLTEA